MNNIKLILHKFIKDARLEEAFVYCNENIDNLGGHGSYYLGCYYFSQNDLEKATFFFSQALNSSYDRGKVVYALARVSFSKLNFSSAFDKFLQSEMLGCGRSCYWIGSAYFMGCGVDVNKNKAKYYFKKGKKQGYLVCERAYLYYFPSIGTSFISPLFKLALRYRVAKIAYLNKNDEKLSDIDCWSDWERGEILYSIK